MIFAEAVTLAHVARPIALSRILRDLGHDVCIAAAPSADRWLEGEDVSRERIESIDSQRFLRALARGSPPYDTATFIRYVEDDLRAIRAWRPDIVIGDFRLSLYISARLAGKPYGAIANAYWSRTYWQGGAAPPIAPFTWFPRSLASNLFDAIRPAAFAFHALPFHRACRHFGVPSPGLDLRDVYTASNVTAFADVRELYEPRSTGAAESQAHFVGPLAWYPAGISTLPSFPPGAPIVFVSLGSSGTKRALSSVLDAISGISVRCIVATAGLLEPSEVRTNCLWSSNYVPYAIGCKAASLVICNGGAPATYAAIEGGLPVLAIPQNLDQVLNMVNLQRARDGRAIQIRATGAAPIRAAIQALLAKPQPVKTRCGHDEGQLRGDDQAVRHWVASLTKQDPRHLARRVE